MDIIKLDLFDETLRDGEQQAGIVFSPKQKYQFAKMIKAAGIPFIDIMPSVHPTENALLKQLLDSGFSDCMVPACLMDKADIDSVIAIGAKKIILFNACSDRLMFLRDKEIQLNECYHGKTLDDGISTAELIGVRQRVLAKTEEIIRAIKEKNQELEIMFAAEDASRADTVFLDEMIDRLAPFLSSFLLCDTVGILSPDKAKNWLARLVDKYPQVSFGVHFHNDMGLALENTIQAVLSGASLVSGTFLGIGERAGNVALEQVLNGLRVRYGLEVDGINYGAVEQLCKYMKASGIRPFEPYSKEARMHETGIHVNALIKDRFSYSNFQYENFEICFGKYSGVSGFEFLLNKHLQIKLPEHRYVEMRNSVKEISISQQRCFTPTEILAMYENGVI